MPSSPKLPRIPGTVEADPPADEQRQNAISDVDALDFVRDSEVRQRAARSAEPTLQEVRQLHAEGRNEEALLLLAELPEVIRSSDATALAVECRAALERDCWNDIGSEASILICEFSPEEVKLFALDNVSGFLLSLLDGTTDVAMVLDLCGLSRLLALRHLRRLVRRGIVVVHEQ